MADCLLSIFLWLKEAFKFNFDIGVKEYRNWELKILQGKIWTYKWRILPFIQYLVLLYRTPPREVGDLKIQENELKLQPPLMSGSCFNFKLVWANRCMGQWYVSALLSPSKGLCTQMDLFLLLNICVNYYLYNQKSSTVLSYRKCWWVSSDKIIYYCLNWDTRLGFLQRGTRTHRQFLLIYQSPNNAT